LRTPARPWLGESTATDSHDYFDFIAVGKPFIAEAAAGNDLAVAFQGDALAG
jgi:hypothetical protein